jgi:hypothetical protein
VFGETGKLGAASELLAQAAAKGGRKHRGGSDGSNATDATGATAILELPLVQNAFDALEMDDTE